MLASRNPTPIFEADQHDWSNCERNEHDHQNAFMLSATHAFTIWHYQLCVKYMAHVGAESLQ